MVRETCSLGLLDKTNPDATPCSVLRHALVSGLIGGVLCLSAMLWNEELQEYWTVVLPLWTCLCAFIGGLWEWQMSYQIAKGIKPPDNPGTENFPLLHDPQEIENTDTWFTKIPIVGSNICYSRQRRNEIKLVRQAVRRGRVPESEWESHRYDKTIREKLEQIVIDWAYPKGSTFHPGDPFELMMVIRYGDLNEVGIMRDIEDTFGIEFTDKLCEWLVRDEVSFIDFIHYIERA